MMLSNSLVLWICLAAVAMRRTIKGESVDVMSESFPIASFPDKGDLTIINSEAPTFSPVGNHTSGNIFDYDTKMEETTGGALNGLEILVAIFFFVAAAWLLIAVFYALLALVVLRLRSRGRLDIDDEEFGRFYLPGTRFYIPCGCLIRRYVVAFGHVQDSDVHQRSKYRSIGRKERRRAVKGLLLGVDKKHKSSGQIEIDEELGDEGVPTQNPSDESHHKIMQKSETDSTSKDDTNPDYSGNDSSEEPVCSICLVEYDNGEIMFDSKICVHKMHLTCILDWLERRCNTDCPCCRQPLVSEEAIWESVKKRRKEKEARMKKQQKKDRRWYVASSITEKTGEKVDVASEAHREIQDENQCRQHEGITHDLPANTLRDSSRICLGEGDSLCVRPLRNSNHAMPSTNDRDENERSCDAMAKAADDSALGNDTASDIARSICTEAEAHATAMDEDCSGPITCRPQSFSNVELGDETEVDNGTTSSRETSLFIPAASSNESDVPQ